VAVSLENQAEVISEPGANMSTHGPMLENEERTSVDVVDATVMTSDTRFGEPRQASELALPAATAKKTPAAIPALTALSMAGLAPPPRLMLATAGRRRLAVTHSTPAMTFDTGPAPEQPSTRTGCKMACLAVP